MTKSKTTHSITIDDDMWHKVKEDAQKENRPVSNFIETVLLKYYEEKENKKSGD